MPDPAVLGVFLVASLGLLIVPGPAVMYIVARGIQQGRAAALVSTLGVEVGTLIQLLVATFGLAALVASSDVAFSALKFLGVAYLVWLAVNTALNTALDHGSQSHAETQRPATLMPIFLQGVMVESLNPKTALFFLAFLPQFADRGRGSFEWQILALGTLFILLAICIDGLFGLLAGTLGGRFRGNSSFAGVQRHLTGCVYTTLAINAALIGPGPF